MSISKPIPSVTASFASSLRRSAGEAVLVMLLLFSAATCMAQRVKEVSADELTMTCSKAMEHNEIYIIFSATPFVKAQDDRTDERLPRSLPAGDFRRWLTKNRVKDKDMVVINRLIKVTKR